MDPTQVLREELEAVVDDDTLVSSTNYTGDFLIALGLLAVVDQLHVLENEVRTARLRLGG